MSRIGKRPIPIPNDVEIGVEGDLMRVKGPKGELSRRIHPNVSVNMEDGQILVTAEGIKDPAALQGLFRMLIANMVTGVTTGFEKGLEIVGIGYRAEVKGNTAVLHLGYSNPVNFELPQGIEARVEKNTLVVSGIDKELVGLTAARIRSLRKPESYKGKGVRYAGETVRKKAGKAGAK